MTGDKFEKIKTYVEGAHGFLVETDEELRDLVRCKDCKNADFGTDEDGNKFMKCIGSVKCYGGTTPDFFCADGRRKTEL